MPVRHNFKVEADQNLEIHGDIFLSAHIYNGVRSLDFRDLGPF